MVAGCDGPARDSVIAQGSRFCDDTDGTGSAWPVSFAEPQGGHCGKPTHGCSAHRAARCQHNGEEMEMHEEQDIHMPSLITQHLIDFARAEFRLD